MNWIAQLNDQEELSTMVQALGRLLRASIDPRNTAISLREEIDLLKQYISIQKVRYGERLQVVVDLPEECAGFGIPKLTLQPLVENSIRYGLERFAHPCTIRIGAHLNGEGLVLTVSDNGPGMESAFVEALLRGEIQPKGCGVGVINIYERIRRLYGESAGLDIESKPGLGTTVYLRIPPIAAGALMERIKKAHETEVTSYSS
jgi:two-component system sensor histidine kinase YesM